MTEEKIKEGNKLIAEFMGYRVFEKRYPRNHGIGAGMNQPKDVILEKCRYDHDWRWLMPVVEKIAEIGMSSEGECKKEAIAVCSLQLSINIETAYLRIVGFIKWYNENKQS